MPYTYPDSMVEFESGKLLEAYFQPNESADYVFNIRNVSAFVKITNLILNFEFLTTGETPKPAGDLFSVAVVTDLSKLELLPRGESAEITITITSMLDVPKRTYQIRPTLTWTGEVTQILAAASPEPDQFIFDIRPD